MQLGGAVGVVEPQCPVHARQGGQQGAVDELEALGKRSEAGVTPSRVDFPGEIQEDLLEDFGIENRLGFREAAEADLSTGDFFLHAFQMAGGTEAAHAIDDWIEQPEEHEAEIILFEQEPFGTAGLGFGWRGICRVDLCESPTEIVQQLPTAELFFVDFSIGAAHTRSESEST